MPEARRYWWANQSRSFDYERQHGCLAAPQRGKDGRRVPGYERMRELRPHDFVLHSDRGVVRAIGEILSIAVEGHRPYPYPGITALTPEWLASVAYTPLSAPFTVASIPLEWRCKIDGPFDANGEQKREYLSPLPSSFVQTLKERYGLPLP